MRAHLEIALAGLGDRPLVPGGGRGTRRRRWLARNSSSSLVGEELVVVAGLGFRTVGVLVPLVGRVFLSVGAKDFGLAFVRPSLCWDVIAGLLGGHDVDVGWAAVLVGRVGWVKKMRIGERGCCCVRSEVSAKVLRARPLL